MEKVLSRTDPDTVVQIAGACPAGLAAAITLASAGRKVVVHETQKEVGHRFGGDFQGLENWSTPDDVMKSWKASALATNFSATACDRGIVFNSAGKAYEIKTREPLFCQIKRRSKPGTLDSTLLGQALSIGVELRFNGRLRQMSGDGILATGPRAANAIAVGYHFETVMEYGYGAICDNSLAPNGYAYLLVQNGRARSRAVCFQVLTRRNSTCSVRLQHSRNWSTWI